MSRRAKKYFLIGTICILGAASIFANNVYEDYKVGKGTEIIVNKIISKNEDKKLREKSIKNKKREMPVKEIDGKEYIGYLEIDSLKLKLPVMYSWSYENISTAPARFKGSVYENNMIVLAHNYKSHFGNLHRLKTGNIIRFYDMDNNRFIFRVKNKEEIKGDDVQKLQAGKWDLTLFTCSLDDRFRTVIRCESVV